MKITSAELKTWLLELNKLQEGRVEYLSFYDLMDALHIALPNRPIQFRAGLPSGSKPAGLSFDETMDFLDEDLVRIERNTEASILTASYRKLKFSGEQTVDYGIRSWMTKQYNRIDEQDEFAIAEVLGALLNEMVLASPVEGDVPEFAVHLHVDGLHDNP